MTPKPKVYTIPFLTKLTPAQHADLRAAAEAEGVSMATVIRDALEAWLARIGPRTPAERETEETQ